MAKKERSKVYWWQVWFGVFALLWLATMGRCVLALAETNAEPFWLIPIIAGILPFGIGLWEFFE